MLYNSQAPTYDNRMIHASMYSPSTVHCKNTELANYFARVLMTEVYGSRKWTMPETWSQAFWKWVYYSQGYIAIIKTKRFGVIPMNCGFYKQNLYYEPLGVVVANPILQQYEDEKTEYIIGRDAALVKYLPDYSTVIPVVSYYADMLALCAETIQVNLMNSRVSFIFPADGKAEAESFKKMYDQIASGNPAAFIKKTLMGDGGVKWQPFAQNVGQNYLVTDTLNDMATLMNQFRTAVGIPNANLEKRERLITDEVRQSSAASMCTAYASLEETRRGLEEANRLFGLSLAVEEAAELLPQPQKEGDGTP